jgi:hypothetical protein
LEAKIYRPAKNFPHYRVAFWLDGRRKMMTFGTYGEAKVAAEAKLREIHKGHKSAALTAGQSRDALVAVNVSKVTTRPPDAAFHCWQPSARFWSRMASFKAAAWMPIIHQSWMAAQSQTTLPLPPAASASNNLCG